MNGGGDTKWYVLWIAYCFLFYLFTFKKCRLSKFCFFFLSIIITFNLCHVRYRLSIKHFHGHLLTTRSIENWKERIENWHAKPTNYFFFSSRISFLNFFCFFTFLIIWLQTLYLFCWRRLFFFRLSSREPFMESSNNCTCSKTDKEYVITRLVLFCNIVQLWIDYEDVSSTTTTMKL